MTRDEQIEAALRALIDAQPQPTAEWLALRAALALPSDACAAEERAVVEAAVAHRATFAGDIALDRSGLSAACDALNAARERAAAPAVEPTVAEDDGTESVHPDLKFQSKRPDEIVCVRCGDVITPGTLNAEAVCGTCVDSARETPLARRWTCRYGWAHKIGEDCDCAPGSVATAPVETPLAERQGGAK